MPGGGLRWLGTRHLGGSIAPAMWVHALCGEVERVAAVVSQAMDSLTAAQAMRFEEVLQATPGLIPDGDPCEERVPEDLDALGRLGPEVRRELDCQRALLAVLERVRSERPTPWLRTVALREPAPRRIRSQRPRSSRRRAQRAVHRATAGPEPPSESPRRREAPAPEGAEVEKLASPKETP